MLALTAGGHVLAAPTVRVPSGIDPAPWEMLLKKYVNDEGLVAYQAWKRNAADVRTLDEFIAAYAAITERPAHSTDEIAALINGYNAFTIRWVLQHYPTESIQKLDDSFDAARWNIGGRKVSLDDLARKNLRPLYGWMTHATLVTAARSSPPLQREAYTGDNLIRLTGDAYRAWLARDDLNVFDRPANRVVISPIFKWFKRDFVGDGEIALILTRYGPEELRGFFQRGDFKIKYTDFHWGLNDQGGLGINFEAGIWDRWFNEAK